MSNWTFQTSLTPSSGSYNNCLDAETDHGTTLAMFFVTPAATNECWRSTNGGTSWTKVHTFSSGGAMGKLLYAGVIGGNKTWYALGTIGGTSYKSTDDGATWSTTTDVMPGGGCNAGAWDGNVTILGAQNNNSNLECSVNGSALTLHATPTDWVTNSGRILWDGTQFVSLPQHSAAPTTYSAFTAPSGFTAAAGPSWTEVFSSSSPIWVSPNNGVTGVFSFVPGLGYAVAVSGGKLVLSSTVAGLGTNTPSSPPLDAGSFVSMYGAAGLLFWSNSAQKTYRSADGSTWTNDTFSQALQATEKVHGIVYDSTNATLILIGSIGDVYTGPPPVVISPSAPTVTAGGTQVFSVTTVPANTPVTWSCLNGFIDQSGNYTAPTSGFSSDVVTATWQSNSNIFGTAPVTISAQSVVVSPANSSVNFGAQEQFTAVTNPSGLGVTWSCLHGAISQAGLYSAPALPVGSPTDTVTAALSNNLSISNQANVNFTIPTVTTQGKGVGGGGTNQVRGTKGAAGGGKAFPPVVLANIGTIQPQVHMPGENTTVKSQS